MGTPSFFHVETIDEYGNATSARLSDFLPIEVGIFAPNTPRAFCVCNAEVIESFCCPVSLYRPIG